MPCALRTASIRSLMYVALYQLCPNPPACRRRGRMANALHDAFPLLTVHSFTHSFIHFHHSPTRRRRGRMAAQLQAPLHTLLDLGSEGSVWGADGSPRGLIRPFEEEEFGERMMFSTRRAQEGPRRLCHIQKSLHHTSSHTAWAGRGCGKSHLAQTCFIHRLTPVPHLVLLPM